MDIQSKGERGVDVERERGERRSGEVREREWEGERGRGRERETQRGVERE
jgi:hypothetical protein